MDLCKIRERMDSTWYIQSVRTEEGIVFKMIPAISFVEKNLASWCFEHRFLIGKKLVGTEGVGNQNLGSSVALSRDGKLLVIGGPGDSDVSWICA